MRIALILFSTGYGGLERHTIDLSNALSERHRVFLLADPAFAPRLNPRVTLIPINPTASRWNLFALWQLRRQLQRIRPEVIHAQANKAAAMVRRCGATAPLRVATIHNLKNDPDSARGFDRVIAVSAPVAASLRHPDCRVVLNGIDPPPPAAAEAVDALRQQFAPDGAPLILAIGRLVPAKGFDLLLAAWQNLPGQLVIIGSGAEESALRAQAAAHPDQPRIHFVGYRDDIPTWLAAADLLVMPSRREGFPYTLIEALHSGLPVVASDFPGAADFLPEQAVVPRENIPALHAALQQALTDLAVTRDQFSSAFAKARAELTLQQMREKTEAVYAS
ncbi:glycosyltransferase [Halothiobacillus sp. DCM-1]|uniref:glycosyltransferase n=1 Tax=Halothiobacillus sp. DCM-1 TaxID=3112558 RepID=UPI00324B3392